MIYSGLPHNFLHQLSIYCAALFFAVSPAFSQSMELKPSSSEDLAVLIEKVREQTSKIEEATEKSLELGILNSPESESVFDEMIDRMAEVHRSISQESEFYKSISAQEKSLSELQDSLNADSALLGDARYENLQLVIEQRREEVAVLKARLDESISELERGISEVESLKLFVSYQVRLSQFSEAVDTMESALVVSRESIANINEIADSLSAIDAATN